MQQRTRPVRALSRAFAVLATMIFAFAVAEIQAQTTPAAPPKQATPPKTTKKPPKTPTAQPEQPKTPTAAEQQIPVLVPPLIYRRWTKVCAPKDPGAPADATLPCFVIMEGRDDGGTPVVRATVVVAEGEAKSLLVSFIYGVDLLSGTTVAIDEGPMRTQQPYFICVPPNFPGPMFGCVSQYVINSAVVTAMKKGQNLTVATQFNGQRLSPKLPLNDFAQAFDGPPTDLKAEAEQQAKLQEALRDVVKKKEEEAVKKLNQPGSK
jgi:invasion protein IalB